jgi:anti-sigma-K factor RskA
MNDDLHTLSGAYALHALPEFDERLFEEHMARCEACLVEVRGLRETAARLGLAAAEAPPPALRVRVMNRVAEVRQEPPAALGYEAPGRVSRRRPSRRRPPRGSWRTRVAVGLATVSTAAAAALGYLTVTANRELDQVRNQAQVVASVLAAPDARTVTRKVASGGSATIVRSRSKGRVVFAASGLSGLPASKVYELWLMGPAGVRPAGLLRQSDDGVVAPVVALPLSSEERVGLTVEPAGGSPQPTTEPILLTKLPTA